MELDENEIESALDGNVLGLSKLGRKYLDWFVRKTEFRTGIQKHELNEAMELLIRRSISRSEQLTYSVDWQQTTSKLISRHASRRIFEEAVSSGVIEVSGQDSWQWTNPICFRNLPTGALSE